MCAAAALRLDLREADVWVRIQKLAPNAEVIKAADEKANLPAQPEPEWKCRSLTLGCEDSCSPSSPLLLWKEEARTAYGIQYYSCVSLGDTDGRKVPGRPIGAFSLLKLGRCYPPTSHSQGCGTLDPQRGKVAGAQTARGHSVDAFERNREFHKNELSGGGGIGADIPPVDFDAVAKLP